MDRKLIEYLPPFVRGYKEIELIMNTEQVDCEKLWNDAENVLADGFVVDATESGIARHEKILGITSKGNNTLDERRFSILARMSEQVPYTMETLKHMLASLCGENGYTLRLDPNAYALSIKLALTNESNIQAVSELLEKVVPANITKSVALFNTNLSLAGFTNEQLAAFTHKGIREDIL